MFVESFLLELKQEEIKNGGDPHTPTFFIIEGLEEVGQMKRKNKNLHQ